MPRLTTKLTSGLGIALVLTLLAAAPAEARRGGSFGSRGARTYVAPKPTNTAPHETAPVQRSMTAQPPAGAQGPATAPGARPAQTQGAPAQVQAPRRGGFMGGLGGGILGGLLAGGLIGMLMGNGFGAGMAGVFGALLQVALIAGVVFLVVSLFRRRKTAQPAFASGASGYGVPAPNSSSFEGPRGGYVPASPAPGAAPTSSKHADEVGLTQRDLDTFERLLSEVQGAFAREDYAALRERTTPEIMSYLSEELSQNAVAGRRNEVSGTRLLQADIAEAWAEGRALYATAALRYESIDVMRDRQSGAVLAGDPAQPTQTTELWTFVQDGDEPWKLSAIQEA